MENFDKEFIGFLDKYHNRFYFEINDRINSLEPEPSKLEEIEEEIKEKIKDFIRKNINKPITK